MGSESITNQNAALIIDHQSDFTTPPKKRKQKTALVKTHNAYIWRKIAIFKREDKQEIKPV